MSNKERSNKILSARELAVFFESMGMLMRAGIPVSDCPALIRQDASADVLSEAAGAIESVLGTETFMFSEALEKTEMFPTYAVKATKVGELSGRQEESFFALSAYYRQEYNLQQQIKSAVLSPAILVTMMAAVLFVTVLWILPVLSKVFSQLGLDVTSGGIGFALLAGRVAMILTGILLVVVLVFAVSVLAGSEETRERVLSLLPRAKDMLRVSAMAKLASSLAAFLKSGLLPAEALENAIELSGSRLYQTQYKACLEAVQAGDDLGKSLVETGIFTGFESHILLSATRAGQLDVAMEKAADLYGEESAQKTDKMLATIEPALVGLLTVAVSIILVAVLLPLIQMMSAIG